MSYPRGRAPGQPGEYVGEYKGINWMGREQFTRVFYV